MSFYSYKNANPCSCPGVIAGNAMEGLQEKVCIQVKRVYDSCLQQEQLDDMEVTITSYAMVSKPAPADMRQPKPLRPLPPPYRPSALRAAVPPARMESSAI